MKTKLELFAICHLLSAIPFSVCAQGTAFTYQGRLNSGGGLAGGSYDVTFTLFNASSNGSVLAGPVTNSATVVSNGLFTTLVDFGPGVFTGGSNWLEIAVRTNNGGSYTTLTPRQQLTPTPYALMAGSASNLLGTLPTAQLTGTFPASQLSGAIPSANLAGTYGNAVSFNNGADSFDGTFVGQFFGSSFFGGSFNGNFFGDGGGLYNLNASQLTSGTVPDARLAGNVAFLNSNQVFTSQNVFQQPVGFGNPSPVYAVDAMAAQAVGRFVSTNAYFGSVLVLQNQTTNLSSDFLGAVNFNDPFGGTPGQMAYIASNSTNQNYDFLRFYVGGTQALVLKADPRGAGIGSLIGGSWWNFVDPSSGGDVIAGGGYPYAGNIIYSNSFSDFIGAGSANQIGPNVNDAVIVGGYQSTIQLNAGGSFIGGGYANIIETNADHSTIGGGWQNRIQTFGWESVISGGELNLIGPGAQWAAIGGGEFNTNNSSFAFIGGGSGHYIQFNSWGSLIGAGYQNSILTGSGYSIIAGGYQNAIMTDSSFCVVGGGEANQIQNYSLNSTIGGGYGNIIQGNYSLYNNNNDVGSTIGGGDNNQILTNGFDSTISGGLQNVIQANALAATIAGGFNNVVLTNVIDGSIGGGSGNHVGGNYAVVPGGYGNAALGHYSFAAGTDAQATNNGAFVLADNELTNFYSTASNQLSARFTGGVRFVTGGAGMTLDGQSILTTSYGNPVSLNNASNNFTGNGAGLNNVNAATLNGSSASAFAPASGSANYIQNQNAGPQTASLNISGNAVIGGSLTASNAQFTGLLRSGSESGTGSAPSPAGLVIRRINSLANTLSNVVARTDVLTLERDGSNEGLLLRYPAGTARQTINCLAQTLSGTNIILHASLNNPASAGTIQLLTSAQHAVHASISFGNTFNSGQLTQVVIDRYDDGTISDYYWVGTLTSTYNQ